MVPFFHSKKCSSFCFNHKITSSLSSQTHWCSCCKRTFASSILVVWSLYFCFSSSILDLCFSFHHSLTGVPKPEQLFCCPFQWWLTPSAKWWIPNSKWVHDTSTHVFLFCFRLSDVVESEQRSCFPFQQCWTPNAKLWIPNLKWMNVLRWFTHKFDPAKKWQNKRCSNMQQ